MLSSGIPAEATRARFQLQLCNIAALLCLDTRFFALFVPVLLNFSLLLFFYGLAFFPSWPIYLRLSLTVHRLQTNEKNVKLKGRIVHTRLCLSLGINTVSIALRFYYTLRLKLGSIRSR